MTVVVDPDEDVWLEDAGGTGCGCLIGMSGSWMGAGRASMTIRCMIK
jgi:hypothetical protein